MAVGEVRRAPVSSNSGAQPGGISSRRSSRANSGWAARKPRDHPFGLLRGAGAQRIDQPAAGAHQGRRFARIAGCSRGQPSRCRRSLRRQRSSGLRRSTPRPLQGASTSTRLEARRRQNGGRPVRSQARTLIPAQPRRSRLRAPGGPFLDAGRGRGSAARLPARAARWVVLPPGAAQASRSRSPGLRRQQVGDEHARLVLHLEPPLGLAGQRRRAAGGEVTPSGAKRGRVPLVAGRPQRAPGTVAVGAQGVDPQGEGGRLQQRLGQRQRLGGAQLRSQRPASQGGRERTCSR